MSNPATVQLPLGALPEGARVSQIIYIVEQSGQSDLTNLMNNNNEPVDRDTFKFYPALPEESPSTCSNGKQGPAGVVCCCHRPKVEISPENPLIGLPSPVSYFAFGATVLLANLSLTGVVESNILLTAFIIIFGGLVQFISGFFELINKNTVGCFISTGYGAYNLFNGFATKWAGTEKEPSPGFLGGVYFIWVFFALTVFGMCYKSPLVSVVLFALVVLNFLLCTIGTWGASDTVMKAAGYEGVVAGIFALYVSISFALKSAHGVDVLPLIHHDNFRNFRW